jgi:uncharacterized protein
MKKKRGFAAMSESQRKAIARKGGQAAQQTGKAHRWTTAEAIDAGRKGGKVSQERGTGYRFNSKTGSKAAGKRNRKRR